jgi:hypothetical protein
MATERQLLALNRIGKFNEKLKAIGQLITVYFGKK